MSDFMGKTAVFSMNSNPTPSHPVSRSRPENFSRPLRAARAALLAGLAMAVAPGASAALNFSLGDPGVTGPTGPVVIPDNNLNGLAYTFTVAEPGQARIADVSVSLNISGGYNGDLYAYLSHEGGGFAVLLNRVGVGAANPGGSTDGYAGGGFNVTLSSAGAANIHFYQNGAPTYAGGQLTGEWQPDGWDVLPTAAPAKFDAPGTADFRGFIGSNPNGQWTLFLADTSPLDTSRLNDFSVRIVPVPEANTGLPVAITVLAAVLLARGRRVLVI